MVKPKYPVLSVTKVPAAPSIHGLGSAVANTAVLADASGHAWTWCRCSPCNYRRPSRRWDKALTVRGIGEPSRRTARDVVHMEGDVGYGDYCCSVAAAL